MNKMMRCASLAAAIAAVATPARAQDAAEAQALFEEGRRLMGEQKFEEACKKFEASEKIDPALGTLMNLADCHERAGHTATAWLRFKQALGEATRQHRRDREATAREHIAALEQKLPKLAVQVTAPADDEEVFRDGERIDAAAYGIPIAVDPGHHHVEAKAAHRRTWTQDIDVPDGAGVTPLTIPPLEVAEEAPAPQALSAVSTAPVREVPRGNGQRIAGLVVAGVGVVAVGVGSALGLLASSSWSDAKTNHCVGTVCDATGVSLAGDARSMADASTGLFIGGAIAVAAGILIFFVAPHARKSTSISVGPAGIVGSF